MRIDAHGLHYRELNARVRQAAAEGQREFYIDNVLGHRYIGAGLPDGVRLRVDGTPGNDLGAFMDGAEVLVDGNAQDGVGNTMNAGRIAVMGHAGDIPGYSMRGGTVLVRDSVGYRAGIHMKAYRERLPVLVVGGTADDYLGEYMAGGLLLVLGIGAAGSSPVGQWVGTGMHGGVIYVRGPVAGHQAGAEVGLRGLEDGDWPLLQHVLDDFRSTFGLEHTQFRPHEFVKLLPQTKRPYGALYAY
jgi:glutamate synthase domain-containing protein 3